MRNFLPRTLRDALLCLLIAAMFALVVRVFISAGRLGSQVGETTAAAQSLVLEAQGAIGDYRRTATENEKAIRATIELGAVLNGSGRLVNTQLIPRLMKTADASTLLLTTANENAVTLNRTIANLDSKVSGKDGVLEAAIALLRTIDGTAERLGVTASTLDRMLSEIGARAGLSLDAVYELISSPQWHQALQNLTIVSGNVARTSEKVDATAEQVRLAMLNAPEIADSLNKIAKASSKYARITLLANLLLVLSRAFLP
jgi:hypothetical protein